MKTKKLLFVSTKLGGGGAERILSYILSEFAKEPNNAVTLLLLHDYGNNYLSRIPANVKIVNLGIKSRIRYAVFSILRSIVGHRPDVCYVGLDKLNIMLAFFLPIMKCLGIKTIVRETNVLSQQYNNKNLFIKGAYKIFYNLYDLVIAQSKDMSDDLVEKWGINRKKVVLINNPVDIVTIKENSISKAGLTLPTGCFNFVSVGRLSWQKGYDILLKRIAEVAGMGFPIHFTIVGNGEREKEIRESISQLNIKHYVTMAGFQENPYSVIAQADAVVLSSRYEGFPNVLLEANALGKPVLSNKCPGGINEIVINGLNGMVCDFEDSVGFGRVIKKFLHHTFNHDKILEITAERYSMDKIMPKYKEVFSRF